MNKFTKLGLALACAPFLMVANDVSADEVILDDFSTVEGVQADFEIPIVDTSADIVETAEPVIYAARAAVEPVLSDVYPELPGYYIYDQGTLDSTLAEHTGTYADTVWNFVNNDAIVFPENHVMNVYTTEEAANWRGMIFNFPGGFSGDVDFNGATINLGDKQFTTVNMHGDQGGRTISNLTTNGSVVYSYDGDKVSTVTNGNATGRIIEASNVTFDNITHNISHNMGSHTFDLMGVENLTIKNSNFNGYLAGLNEAGLIAVNANNPHSVYAEAVQVDSMTYSAAGVKDYNEKREFFLFSKMEPSGKSSKNVNIINNVLGPYNGPTGDSIIKGDSTVVNAIHGASTGAHSVSRKDGEAVDIYENITIRGNVFENTVFPNTTIEGTDRPYYPIHMLTHDRADLERLLAESDFSNNYYVDVMSDSRKYKSGSLGAAYVGYYESENPDQNGTSYRLFTREVDGQEITDLEIVGRDGLVHRIEGWRVRDLTVEEEVVTENPIGHNEPHEIIEQTSNEEVQVEDGQPIIIDNVDNGSIEIESEIVDLIGVSDVVETTDADGRNPDIEIIDDVVEDVADSSANVENVAESIFKIPLSVKAPLATVGGKAEITVVTTPDVPRQTPRRSERNQQTSEKILPETGDNGQLLAVSGAMLTVFGLLGLNHKKWID